MKNTTPIKSQNASMRAASPKHDHVGQKRKIERVEEDSLSTSERPVDTTETSAGVRLGLDESMRRKALNASTLRIQQPGKPRQLGPFADVPAHLIPRSVPGGPLKNHDDSDSDFENFV